MENAVRGPPPTTKAVTKKALRGGFAEDWRRDGSLGNRDMDDTKFMALEWHCLLGNGSASIIFRISIPQISWWPSIISDGTECGGKWVVTIVEHVESRFAELMRTLNWS